mgnify:CR=1 FL=1
MASYLDRAARAPGTAQQPWTEEVENVDNLSTIVDKLSTWASNRQARARDAVLAGRAEAPRPEVARFFRGVFFKVARFFRGVLFGVFFGAVATGSLDLT